MLTKRIIPCLDVRNNKVVKGVQFLNHKYVGEILPLATMYAEAGADELVFYDITASCDERSVSPNWVNLVAKTLNIPFTVAGGIRTLEKARALLHAGADKISLNSPALENPSLINQLSEAFGSQCVVIGIDSFLSDGEHYVYQYTGDAKKSRNTKRKTLEWVEEVQARGAGEIVLNCMQSDGVQTGFDIEQLQKIRTSCTIPLIASGGAGKPYDFVEVFQQTGVDGALAASIFHEKKVSIFEVKRALKAHKIEVRL